MGDWYRTVLSPGFDNSIIIKLQEPFDLQKVSQQCMECVDSYRTKIVHLHCSTMFFKAVYANRHYRQPGASGTTSLSLHYLSTSAILTFDEFRSVMMCPRYFVL